MQKEKTSKDDFIKLIGVVFAEFGAPADVVIAKWFRLFGHIDRVTLQRAVVQLGKMKTYGAPKSADFAEALEKVRKVGLPQCLKCSVGDAERLPRSNLFRRGAVLFAETNSPVVGQCATPEDLSRANLIRQATWRKHFRSKIEQLQQAAQVEIAQGLDPRHAVIRAVENYSDIEIPARAYEVTGLEPPKQLTFEYFLEGANEG